MGSIKDEKYGIDKHESATANMLDKTVLFPANRIGPQGSCISRIRAIPKNVAVRLPVGCTWWVDCAFVPRNDSQLVIGARPLFPSRSGECIEGRGLISVCTIKAGEIESQSLRGNCTARPVIITHPKGHLLYHLGERGYVSKMALYCSNKITTEIGVADTEICTIDVSADGRFLAYVIRRTYVNEIFYTLELMSAFPCKRLASVHCCSLNPSFRGTPRRGNNVACRFSPDSSFIALAISSGELIVVERQTLKLFRSVVPGILPNPNICLPNEQCFDFHPHSWNSCLTFAGRDGCLYFCDIEIGEVIQQTQVHVRNSIDCIKYSRSGEVLAIASAGCRVVLLNVKTGSAVTTLDVMSREANQSARVTQMSFNHFGSVLAAASSDGYVRLWNALPEVTLQHLCRRVIIQSVNHSDLNTLPLPPSLKVYLCQH